MVDFYKKNPYTELLDDIEHATSEELDDMPKFYQYKDDPISALTGIAGIRHEPNTVASLSSKYSDNRAWRSLPIGGVSTDQWPGAVTPER